jgi:hypothetical protein
MNSLRLKIALGFVFLGSGFLMFNLHASKAGALSGASFEPGNIISDSNFFNANSMSANDIQTFLSSKVPTCDTNGTQPSGHWDSSAGRYYTRGEWGSLNGNPPPYTCLKDFSQNVQGAAADSFCTNGVSAGTKSAAMIIAEISWACSINPQALIVTLEKEQNLITDDWPWPIQYQIAMGYGCPDTAPCDAQYYGFFNQVYNAAHQFQRYAKQPQLFNYRGGVTSFILYNPSSSCGGSNVYLQSQATAGLYNYTPYQPNQAALNNLYGSGDGCSAYGNRNFWRLFNDWFGSPTGDLVRANGDQTVYLLSGTKAFPIYDVNVLNDFSALGPVRVTTAAVINTYTSGGVLGRMVGDATSGTLYLVNANIKLPFIDCNSVADYGYNCGQVSYLTTLQLNKFSNGPPVTPLLKAVNSPTVYYVTGGQKRPIPSWGDVQAFKIPIMNILTDSLVNQIPFNGVYANGPGSLIKTLNSASVYVVKDINNVIPLTSFLYTQELGLGTNVRTIASNYSVLSSSLRTKIQCNGSNYVGTNGVTYLIPSAMMNAYGFNQSEFIDGGSACLNPPISSQPLDHFIRMNSGAIFYVTGGQKQLISTYDVYQAHGGNSSNTIQVSNYFANLIADGPMLTQ